MDKERTIGLRIKARREELHMAQVDLATASGLCYRVQHSGRQADAYPGCD